MKAVTVTTFGTPPVLREDVPEPTTGAWQVLVRVQASSANWLEAVGEGISEVEVGDEVFVAVPMAETVRDGAWAELVVTGGHMLTRKPARIDTATAGAATLTAGTAITTVDALDLAPGDTVLAVGAPGGIAVPLARAAGATVLAPGRPEDEEYLRALGASDVLAPGGGLVAAVRRKHPGGVDVLVDAGAAYEITPFAGVVKDGGRIASPTHAAGHGSDRTNVVHGAVPRDPRARGAASRRRHDQDSRRTDLRAAGRGHGAPSPRDPPHTRQDRPAPRPNPVHPPLHYPVPFREPGIGITEQP